VLPALLLLCFDPFDLHSWDWAKNHEPSQAEPSRAAAARRMQYGHCKMPDSSIAEACAVTLDRNKPHPDN